MMIAVYIGLGSNLNNPAEQLNLAIVALQNIPVTSLEIVSSFYQTVPVGYADQPDFINAVAKLNTELSAHELLKYLHLIEQAQGRVRSGERNGPRTLDLDILLFGDLICSDEILTLPHPRMWQREFVLTPLREIAPGLFPVSANIGGNLLTSRSEDVETVD